MFLDDPEAPLSGADIINNLKVFSGTLYPLLDRLENEGWLRSEWEQVEPQELGRPRRRYYSLTALGLREASAEIAEIMGDAPIWKPSIIGYGGIKI